MRCHLISPAPLALWQSWSKQSPIGHFNNFSPMIWWFRANCPGPNLNQYDIDRRTNLIINDIHLVVLLSCVEADQRAVAAFLPRKLRINHLWLLMVLPLTSVKLLILFRSMLMCHILWKLQLCCLLACLFVCCVCLCALREMLWVPKCCFYLLRPCEFSLSTRHCDYQICKVHHQIFQSVFAIQIFHHLPKATKAFF